jgi:4-aminobutyrate aminotransferase-like enzyme/Ser/Thr protein kinase RdoA (MazF antagonist)
VSPERRATPVSEVEAEELARQIYGLDGRAQALPGEWDDNFRLRLAEGRVLVLKVMHPSRAPAFVELQSRILERLAQREPALPLPRVVPSREGRAWEEVALGQGRRLVWALSHLSGTPLAGARPRSPELLEDLGRLLGCLSRGLAGFSHPAAERPDLPWDLRSAGWIRRELAQLAEPRRRALVEHALARFEAEVAPLVPRLRTSVVHGDANDHNVLVGAPLPLPRRVTGLIDFGDLHLGLTVAEPAVGAAYALLGERDPLAAAAHVVRGFHSVFPLEEREIALLDALIRTRLAVSVVNSARAAKLAPDDPYLRVSEAPAWQALERLDAVHPRLAHYAYREACGLPAVPRTAAVVDWIARQPDAAVLDLDLRTAPCVVFDLSSGSLLLGADPAGAETRALSETLFGAMRDAGAALGVGRYDEARGIYSTPLFAGPDGPLGERRSVHLGVDLFVAPGSAVRAAYAGVVHVLARNEAPGDYGPLVVLRHASDAGAAFFTLYGHLGDDALAGLSVGQSLPRGARLGSVGAPPGNGGWPPHLHFQIITDLLDLDADFPGVAAPSRRRLWTSLSPDPNLALRIPAERFPEPEPDAEQTLAARHERLGRNLSVSYRKPLKVARGFGCWLYDEDGRAYLDAYNNVPLVGHSHPRVVAAVRAQLGLLNTNTRYLHDEVVRYAERLLALMPEPLRVCYFLSSGSEANELALRLARAHTRREDVVVLEHAYHGHTSSLVDLSPYKFEGPGGAGRKQWVHVAPLPDDYRGRYRRGDPQAGLRYAAHVGELLNEVRASGRGVAAYLAETLPSVAGQIVFPPGYLAEAYRLARAAGGVCIADEVQAGFGRLGSCFWGFESQGAVPDVVVLGKPIGNGFPLAAVVTTREIAASFDNGMEFFSTFGGNPVACAAGLAVLDVLEAERLQENAARVGGRLSAGLFELMGRFPVIGDVRGLGLFLGADLVLDRESRRPAPLQAEYVANRLRELGVLTGTDGPHHNVIKLRPPLTLREDEAALLLSALERVLGEDAARPD